ncbi:MULTISPECIES: EYxxD motif small membrane protein [Aneurinibacillus]|uniref:Uncharacterized protein n=1 Tax=Aneurinibacillus thermoaerophilus TaxID=143495 RepID=A0A1G8AQZ6_ANETH|nr:MULTISPECIES: EYxxD motif small membrane protein [Aneurinibacillus]MED0676783.1 hypothetical protein [Aneurinibacillus thermoaerophilus]MED0680995.1 hypothetical protein [Aneurinibacillus thermoaerophilus]MED0738590.1 hypothetical protein [Aneurinibacillus thermoaerophilus]MED0758988.1 hypothetical protein [Aneurinibacillus thermoaerophilus]MED0762037.1 hypothetical protein [Aneurinibacillus thermoaerophilus]
MDRLMWEVVSDNLYVILTIVASVIVVAIMWAKNGKSRGRYKS